MKLLGLSCCFSWRSFFTLQLFFSFSVSRWKSGKRAAPFCQPLYWCSGRVPSSSFRPELSGNGTRMSIHKTHGQMKIALVHTREMLSCNCERTGLPDATARKSSYKTALSGNSALDPWRYKLLFFSTGHRRDILFPVCSRYDTVACPGGSKLKIFQRNIRRQTITGEMKIQTGLKAMARTYRLNWASNWGSSSSSDLGVISYMLAESWRRS